MHENSAYSSESLSVCRNPTLLLQSLGYKSLQEQCIVILCYIRLIRLVHGNELQVEQAFYHGVRRNLLPARVKSAATSILRRSYVSGRLFLLRTRLQVAEAKGNL